MKSAGLLLAAMGTLAWGASEVGTYAEGFDRVGQDGWVLLCYSADWDKTHDERWIRRQTSINSSCGNALILYVPIYQNPTPEQTAQVERILQGTQVNMEQLRSFPCAVLLDQDGTPYSVISGKDFKERAAGMIRQAQAQLRTRDQLLRKASQEEGTVKAQTLSSIWRLGITPPANLQRKMHEADPEDVAGIAEWSPFDPWALAERVSTMSWEDACAELDRVEQAQLSKEERQAVLAIRLGCVHHHLGAAGVKDIHRLAASCASLAPNTPLGQAAQRAANLWGQRLHLNNGWQRGELPRVAASCEIAGTRELTRYGEFRIAFIPTAGEDPVRVTCVTLYDNESKVSEDSHVCCLKPGEPLTDNEYMLIVRDTPTHPRLVITFDQQGKTDTQGRFAVRYFTPDGLEVIQEDKAASAAREARKQISERDYQHNEQEKSDHFTEDTDVISEDSEADK